jgi:hypothetical protein
LANAELALKMSNTSARCTYVDWLSVRAVGDVFVGDPVYVRLDMWA